MSSDVSTKQEDYRRREEAVTEKKIDEKKAPQNIVP